MQQTIRELIEDNKNLSVFFSQFSRDSTLKLISSLFLNNDYQSNSLRFECLSIIALVSCNGENIFTTENLKHSLSLLSSSIINLEEPPNDVYVNLLKYNSKIFKILNRIINPCFVEKEIALAKKISKKHDALKSIMSSIESLLELSEIFISQSDIPLCEFGVDDINELDDFSIFDKQTINIPISKINTPNLSDFIIDLPKDILSLKIEELYNKPIYKCGNEYIVYLPTCIGYAIYNRLILEIEKWDGFGIGLIDCCAMFETNETFNLLSSKCNFKEIIRLENQIIDIGYNSRLIKFSGITNEDIQVNVIYIYTFPRINAFNEYKNLENIDFSKSFSISSKDQINIIISDFNNVNFLFEYDKNSLLFSKIEFEAILDSKNFSYIKLLKINELKKYIPDVIMDISKDFKFYYILKNSSEIFAKYIVSKYSSNDGIYLNMIDDISAAFISEYRKRNIRYSEYYLAQNKNVILKRYDRNDEKIKETLVSEDACRAGVLLSLIKFEKVKIWIRLHDNGTEKSFSYDTWNMVTRWIHSFLEKSLEKMPQALADSLNGKTIYIEIKKEAERQNSADIPKIEKLEFEIYINSDISAIKVIVDENFYYALNRDDNFAEYNLISTILNFFSTGVDDSKFISDNLTELFQNKDAKYMHVFVSYNYKLNPIFRSGISSANYLDVNDLLFINLELLKKGYKPASLTKPLEQIEEMFNFLSANLYESLQKLSAIDVIKYFLTKYHFICAEESQWKITSHANIALNNLYAIKNKRNLIDPSKATYRRLLELTTRYGTRTSKELPSTIDLDILAATVFKLLSFAEARDSVYYKLVDDSDISVSDSFEIIGAYADAFRSFNDARTNDNILSSVKSNIKKNELDENKSVVTDLKTGFRLQYGVNLELFFNLIDKLCEGCNAPYIEITYDDLFKSAQEFNSENLSDDTVKQFLYMLILYESESDNTNICNDKFWRTQRPYSLLFHPFIAISRENLIFSISTLLESKTAIISSIYEGAYPVILISKTNENFKIFNSQQANKLAKDFELEVGNKLCELGQIVFTDIENSISISDGNSNLGDIDVISIDKENSKIYLVECKDRRLAITIDDIGKQLKDFSGKKGDANKDDDLLFKHLRRTKWIINNKKFLDRFNVSNISTFNIIPIVVTSKVVPMRFIESSEIKFLNFIDINNLSKDSLASFSLNEDWLKIVK